LINALFGASLFADRLGLPAGSWVGPALALAALWLLGAALAAALWRQVARVRPGWDGGAGGSGGGSGVDAAAGARAEKARAGDALEE
jgi:hypothetical protein